jgi:hypothetical protein
MNAGMEVNKSTSAPNMVNSCQNLEENSVSSDFYQTVEGALRSLKGSTPLPRAASSRGLNAHVIQSRSDLGRFADWMDVIVRIQKKERVEHGLHSEVGPIEIFLDRPEGRRFTSDECSAIKDACSRKDANQQLTAEQLNLAIEFAQALLYDIVLIENKFGTYGH